MQFLNHMNLSIDDINKWGTFIGAIVAALSSIAALIWKYKEKEDKIKVAFGWLGAQTGPGYGLFVTSCSDHKMTLNAFGFINSSGKLLSLPELWANEISDDDDPTATSGTIELNQRGDRYVVCGVCLNEEQIGAFAITTGQNFCTLGFRYDIPWYKRIFLKLKIRYIGSF